VFDSALMPCHDVAMLGLEDRDCRANLGFERRLP
jgi:hypothetical protein